MPSPTAACSCPLPAPCWLPAVRPHPTPGNSAGSATADGQACAVYDKQRQAALTPDEALTLLKQVVDTVGIYAGDGEYIHASTGGGRVMRATFDYFAPDFAKRVIE